MAYQCNKLQQDGSLCNQRVVFHMKCGRRGHSCWLTESGEVYASGRLYDFQNTLRHLNFRSGLPFMVNLFNWVSKSLWGDDLLPKRLGKDDCPPFVSISCSPGSLSGAISGEPSS